MGVWFFLAVSVLYLFAGISLLYEDKVGLALFSLGCVLANIGLAMSAR